jgi:hypothetical protein
LGLDKNIKVAVSSDVGNLQGVTGVAFPYEDAGRIAARHLLSPAFSPGEQLVNGRIIERESISCIYTKRTTCSSISQKTIKGEEKS